MPQGSHKGINKLPAHFKSEKQVSKTQVINSNMNRNSQFRRITRSLVRSGLQLEYISLPHFNTRQHIKASSNKKSQSSKQRSTAKEQERSSNLVKRRQNGSVNAQSSKQKRRNSPRKAQSMMCKPRKLLRQEKEKICFVKDRNLEATFHESRKQSDDKGNQKGIKNSKKELRGQQDYVAKSSRQKETKIVAKTSRKQQSKKQKAAKQNSRKLTYIQSLKDNEDDEGEYEEANLGKINHAQSSPKMMRCHQANTNIPIIKKQNPAIYTQRDTFDCGDNTDSATQGNFSTPLILLKNTVPALAKKQRNKNTRENKKKDSPQSSSQLDPPKTVFNLGETKNKFSASFRHKQLLNGELPLPPHYKELITIFQAIDLKILTERQRGIHTHTLSKLSDALGMSRKIDLTEKHFRQILYLVPQFFTHSWKKRNKYDDPTIAGSSWQLCINFPTNFANVIKGANQCESYKRAMNGMEMQPINKEQRVDSDMIKLRIQVLLKRVLELTLESYALFLATIDQREIPNFDPVEHKTWPHRFNLDNLPDVPLGDIKPAPKRRSKSIQEYMSEQCEKESQLMAEATKAAKKKIASESVKHRKVARSISKQQKVREEEEEEEENKDQVQEPVINIKKINLVEQEPSSSQSQLFMPSTAASLSCYETGSKSVKNFKNQGTLSLMKGGQLGATIVSDASKKPMLLSKHNLMSRQKLANRNYKNEMINLGQPSPSKSPRGILTANILMKLREQEQAKKIKNEWKRAESEKCQSENEYFILEKIAFQLRDLFLNERTLKFPQVVGKIVENFKHLHNRYLSTQEVEDYLRRLIQIVPNYVELLEGLYIKVNNFEINHNGVITQIQRKVLANQ